MNIHDADILRYVSLSVGGFLIGFGVFFVEKMKLPMWVHVLIGALLTTTIFDNITSLGTPFNFSAIARLFCYLAAWFAINKGIYELHDRKKKHV